MTEPLTDERLRRRELMPKTLRALRVNGGLAIAYVCMSGLGLAFHERTFAALLVFGAAGQLAITITLAIRYFSDGRI